MNKGEKCSSSYGTQGALRVRLVILSKHLIITCTRLCCVQVSLKFEVRFQKRCKALLSSCTLVYSGGLDDRRAERRSDSGVLRRDVVEALSGRLFQTH